MSKIMCYEGLAIMLKYSFSFVMIIQKQFIEVIIFVAKYEH